VQQLPLLGVAAFGEGAFDPSFEAGQVFIAGRQDAGGDQDGAQVLNRFAGWELVEGGMAKPRSTGELGVFRGVST
jgi:hypothetical protein